LVVTITSNLLGLITSCMAQLSMINSSWVSSGYSRAKLRATSRNSPEVLFMMLALWTTVTLRRPRRRAMS